MPRTPNTRDRFRQYSHPYDVSEPISYHADPTSQVWSPGSSSLTGAVPPYGPGWPYNSDEAQTQSYDQAQPLPHVAQSHSTESISHSARSPQGGRSYSAPVRSGASGQRTSRHAEETPVTPTAPPGGKWCKGPTSVKNLYRSNPDSFSTLDFGPARVPQESDQTKETMNQRDWKPCEITFQGVFPSPRKGKRRTTVINDTHTPM